MKFIFCLLALLRSCYSRTLATECEPIATCSSTYYDTSCLADLEALFASRFNKGLSLVNTASDYMGSAFINTSLVSRPSDVYARDTATYEKAFADLHAAYGNITNVVLTPNCYWNNLCQRLQTWRMTFTNSKGSTDLCFRTNPIRTSIKSTNINCINTYAFYEIVIRKWDGSCYDDENARRYMAISELITKFKTLYNTTRNQQIPANLFTKNGTVRVKTIKIPDQQLKGNATFQLFKTIAANYGNLTQLPLQADCETGLSNCYLAQPNWNSTFSTSSGGKAYLCINFEVEPTDNVTTEYKFSKMGISDWLPPRLDLQGGEYSFTPASCSFVLE